MVFSYFFTQHFLTNSIFGWAVWFLLDFFFFFTLCYTVIRIRASAAYIIYFRFRHEQVKRKIFYPFLVMMTLHLLSFMYKKPLLHYNFLSFLIWFSFDSVKIRCALQFWWNWIEKEGKIVFYYTQTKHIISRARKLIWIAHMDLLHTQCTNNLFVRTI